MFLSDGLYLPTHRPLPASQVEQIRRAANSNRRSVSLVAPFTPTWWLLVVGALVAAAAIAAQLS
ncbi:hypothetical protein GCM10007881_47390 [Mesorhizobium huakuii]|uniref:Uncharacterized protein n=1 Tax=Mesorhizobium huakuii TaxID=28104 RepID=A0ABZ0VHC6_9HYPH|nr:hypothetical protein [Mesorhizobium huakuii]WQB96207.1 hypothetical protein U0R22_000259 [Mesorhizobium huakuii]GLQ81218.1 hypothetical protein GCM10007881_47390 [Mesorhizobium huakuii]